MNDSKPVEKLNFGRRTWDREEYAELGRNAKASSSSHLGELSDEQLQLLKSRYTQHRKLLADATQSANQRVLTGSLTSYKKGKQFGFYCELCDLTFKDTLQFVDHLNHKLHQIKFETIFGEPLISDLRDNDDIPSQEFEEQYSAEIRAFLKNRGSSASAKTKKIDRSGRLDRNPKPEGRSTLDTDENPALNSVMGFGGFGSTKK
ncbi:LAFA_0G09582g1_1 [Lachancea sp. 'fantastica']|nr:LAFA_0G09582g1_1 [Lachancea sp. 'fantastica']